VASSTGSAHGTVSSEGTLTESIRQEQSMHEIPNFDYLDDSDSFGFHPGRDGAINSTGALDISYSDMKRMLRDKDARNKSKKQTKQKGEQDSGRLPELRATAKKYGKWSPNKNQLSYVVDTSAIGKVFPDFSGGVDSDDDVSRDLGRVRNTSTGNDILVFQDVPGHPDSPKVTISGLQVTATPSLAYMDKIKQLPLQKVSQRTVNKGQQHTGSDYSVGVATKTTNIRKQVFTKTTKHHTTKSTDTIEFERVQSPSKYKNLTSRSVDTLEVGTQQAPFNHLKRHSLPSVTDLSIQDISMMGNKENVQPKSSPLPKANTMSPPRPSIQNPVKSHFQARVRDEFDSSRLSIGSQRESPEDEEMQHNMSVLSDRQNGSFVSLRSATNKHRDNTFESHADQNDQSGSVIINRPQRDATAESIPSQLPEDDQNVSVLTDIVLQGSEIAPTPLVNRNRDASFVSLDVVPSQTTREPSGTSSGTIIHKTPPRSKNNWSSRIPSQRSPTRRGQAPSFQHAVTAKQTETRAADYMSPNLTIMSFIAPFRIISSPAQVPAREIGLPSIKDGRVHRRNQINLEASFDPIAAFSLPDDEEDIYQMCESQKVRISVLEEERAMQNEMIRSLQKQMAAMKLQLAQATSSDQQKWKSHKCVDTTLQDSFNKLQVSTAQIRHECNTYKKENLELKLAKHELETHQCVDTELELENAQLRADVKSLKDERDGHQCVDTEIEEENDRLRNELEEWRQHVCRDDRLEGENRKLREFKEGILGVVKERGSPANSPRR